MKVLVVIAALLASCTSGGEFVPPPVPVPPVEPVPPDSPVPPNPLMLVPSSLHLVQGRPLRVLRSGLTELRDLSPFVIGFSGHGPAGGPPFVGYASPSIDLDGAQLDGPGNVLAWSSADQAVVGQRPITFQSSPAIKAASPKLLVLGDSLAYEGTISAMDPKFQAAGVTPVYLGTYQEVGGQWSEARPSWEFSDFTHRHLAVNRDGSAPTYPIDGAGGDGVVTTVDQYLALPPAPSAYGARWQYNPFVRPASAADPAALIKNGYVFDLRFYLDRFGLPDPDIVFVELGTNDTAGNPGHFGDELASAIDLEVEGLGIMYTQVRAALPRASVAIVVNSFPGDYLWTKHLPFVRYVLQTYGGREAEGVFVLPVYMVVDPATVPDWVHPDAVGRDQWAEMTFAFVMNRL